MSGRRSIVLVIGDIHRMGMFIALLFVMAMLIIGCGGGTDSDGTVDVGSLLIESNNLSEVSGLGVQPPEPCGPVSVLEAAGGSAAVSRTFIVSKAEVVEAVAVFGNSRRASSAYRRLNRERRLRCIQRAIVSFSAKGSIVQLEQPEAIAAGDEGIVSRFHTLGAEGETRGYADVIVIRLGGCIASLLVGSKGSKPPTTISKSVSTTAASLLVGGCR